MKLAVIGTFAWDTIYDSHGKLLFQGPGGLIHSVAALATLAPAQGTIVPIARVHHARHKETVTLLSSLGSVDPRGLIVDSGAPYTVDLHYHGDVNRCECVSHLPSPLTLQEIESHLHGVEGLLVNFISGNDVELECLPLLRARVSGPMVVDLHSLTLGVETGGHRTRLPRLDGWREYLAGVDCVQVNEAEAATLAGLGLEAPSITDGDWVQRLYRCLRDVGVEAFVVTLADRGACLFLPTEETGRRIPAAPVTGALDPTGCGDVHIAAILAGLMHGLSFVDALRVAAQAAAAQLELAGWPRALPEFSVLTARAGIV